ncbi:hypothetical protein ACOSP7_009911 [Xanthoceras sorbifolium]
MSSLSSQRRHENRRNEASISCRQRVDLPRDGALGTIAVAQVTASQGSLLLKGITLSPSQPPPTDVAGARKKGKGVDFDASAEQQVMMGRPTRSVAVGQAALPS